MKLIYKVTGCKVVLIETRPLYNDPSTWAEMPIAQFEYDVTTKEWALYVYDRNDRRRAYSKGSLEKLIQEFDQDSTGIFWR